MNRRWGRPRIEDASTDAVDCCGGGGGRGACCAGGTASRRAAAEGGGGGGPAAGTMLKLLTSQSATCVRWNTGLPACRVLLPDRRVTAPARNSSSVASICWLARRISSAASSGWSGGGDVARARAAGSGVWDERRRGASVSIVLRINSTSAYIFILNVISFFVFFALPWSRFRRCTQR